MPASSFSELVSASVAICIIGSTNGLSCTRWKRHSSQGKLLFTDHYNGCNLKYLTDYSIYSDPVLELAALGKQLPHTNTTFLGPQTDETHWILRAEQQKIDSIVNGTDRGHYHLLIGEKGTGKSSMLLGA